MKSQSTTAFVVLSSVSQPIDDDKTWKELLLADFFDAPDLEVPRAAGHDSCHGLRRPRQPVIGVHRDRERLEPDAARLHSSVNEGTDVLGEEDRLEDTPTPPLQKQENPPPPPKRILAVLILGPTLCYPQQAQPAQAPPRDTSPQVLNVQAERSAS